jgi:hypothetical protein
MSELKNKGEISLKELIEKGKDWFFYLLSNWKIVILAGIIGCSIGLAYAYSKKPIYTASLSFALEDEGSGGGLGGALGLASQFGFDLGGSGGGAFEGSNLIELFKSRRVIEQTLLTPVEYKGKKMSIAEMFIQLNEWRDGWKENPKLKTIQFLPHSDREKFTRVHDSILGVIYSCVSGPDLFVGQKDKKVDIISIDVKSENEMFAKLFSEAIAKQVSDFYIETKSKKARINMDILKRQTDSIRGALNGSITGVAQAVDNTFNLNPAMNVKRAPSSRRQVDVQANTAILTELIKQTELAKVALRKETPLIQVIDRPILPLQKMKFGKLRGIMLGGIISGFLIVLFLILKKVFQDLYSKIV